MNLYALVELALHAYTLLCSYVYSPVCSRAAKVESWLRQGLRGQHPSLARPFVLISVWPPSSWRKGGLLLSV